MPSNPHSRFIRFFPTCHRFLLDQTLLSYSDQISGRCLVVGAGFAATPFLSSIDVDELVLTDINPKNPSISHADLHDLPFEDSSFDSLICLEVFEHLSDPVKAASEILRVLKPRGCALLSTPFLFRVHGDPNDYNRFTSDGLKRLFFGFRAVRVESFGARLHVIFDLLATSSVFLKVLRILSPVLCSLPFKNSADAPTGYISFLTK